MDNQTRPKNTKAPARPAGKPLAMVPESNYAEAAVLGSMMIDPFCIPDVMVKLEAKDFFHSENVVIFQTIRNLYEANDCKGVNGLLVRQKLEDKAILDQIGGTDYLQQLLETLPSSASVDYYVKIVKDKSIRRQWYIMGQELTEAALDTSRETEEVRDEMESRVSEVFEKPDDEPDEARIPSLLMGVYEAVEKREQCNKDGIVLGIPSGFSELDGLTSGFQPGDMIIIAGRPSMGKTAIAMNMLDYLTRIVHKPALMFSMEMGKELLAMRMIASVAEVDSNKMRRGLVSHEDYRKIREAMEKLQEADLYIIDRSSLTPFDLRSRARRFKKEHKVELIVVDYLQLMHVGGKVENRQQEITTISRQLKGIARELEVPVIVLSQLNRAPEGREDHRPRMSDLRESGSLEQDADLVMLLHREAYYHKGEAGWENNNEAEVIIAKQRNGPTGVVKLRFLNELTRFDTPPMQFIEPAPPSETNRPVETPTVHPAPQGSLPWDL